MKRLLILLFVLLAGCASASKPEIKPLADFPFQKRPIIAVMDFENKSGEQQYNVVLQGISDQVIEELLQYGRFRIVERENLDGILSEFKLEMTGFVDEKYVKEIGKHLGVDALLFGSLRSVIHKENKNHAGLAYSLQRKTEVTLSARLVTVETNEILSSSTVTTNINQSRQVALGFARSGNMTDEETAARSAIDIAVRQLANEIADRTPPKN